jgi:hypothetical protein
VCVPKISSGGDFGFRRQISLFLRQNSLFSLRNSLFHRVGKLAEYLHDQKLIERQPGVQALFILAAKRIDFACFSHVHVIKNAGQEPGMS